MFMHVNKESIISPIEDFLFSINHKKGDIYAFGVLLSSNFRLKKLGNKI